MDRDSGCSLTYLRGKGMLAFRFPVEGYGEQTFIFSEIEYLAAGGLGGPGGPIERARLSGGALGSAAALAMEGVLMPLSAIRRAEALPKKRRSGGKGVRAHPRCVRLLRKLGPGERKRRGARGPRGGPGDAELGMRLMDEAVGRAAAECSYAPYRRYLHGWQTANGRRDEPKGLLREFCRKVDERQGKKVS